MKLAAMPWAAWTGMEPLLEALDADGGATRVVGGAVRDTLLGLPVSDVDLATRIAPGEVIERLEAAGIKAVPTGLAHGTITAVIAGRPVEVTTLRRDVETDGRHAVVAFTDDWQADAARRDFTINALSADPVSGEIFDYFGGLEDMATRSVRFIGDPRQRIAEDHLRILRFFRFHARFACGEPDCAALSACSERANDLMALSRERIADELMKLLALPDPGPSVGLMHQGGIFAPVLPEIGGDEVKLLGELIIREQGLGVPADPLRRLAALLPAETRIAGEIAARLKMSNAARVRLACGASRQPEDGKAEVGALAYRFGLACALDRLLLGDVPPDAARLAELDGWQRPRLPIGGGALIARGLGAGPLVAATLRQIEEEWVAAGFPEDAEFDAIVARRLDQACAANSERDSQ